MSTHGFSQELVTAEWPTQERQQLDQAVLMGVRNWSDQCQFFRSACLSTRIYVLLLDWNENVVPRLLPIFRSVEREIEEQKHRRNIETRKQEFADCSAPLVERYKPFLDVSVLRRAPQVQKLLSEDNYQTPVTPERFSSIHDELVAWADQELAPTYSAMANSFRSVHHGVLPPDALAVSDREFLDKVVTMFGCKSCKAVHDSKAHTKHRNECPKATRVRSLGSQGSVPAEKHAVVLALRLLQLLGLPGDSTRALVEQTFCETKFVCLCGNPKFRKQVGFFELVRVVPTSMRLLGLANRLFRFWGSSFNTSFLKTRRTKRSSARPGWEESARTRTGKSLVVTCL